MEIYKENFSNFWWKFVILSYVLNLPLHITAAEMICKAELAEKSDQIFLTDPC